MSVHDDLYMPFWRAFDEFPLGPRQFTNLTPSPKHNKEHGNYMVLGDRIEFGFRPVGTLMNLRDRLGIELISASSGAEHLTRKWFEGIPTPSFGDTPVQLEFPGGEVKIVAEWFGVGLENQDLWPAHFLWIRLGIDLLVKTYQPHIAQYTEENAHV